MPIDTYHRQLQLSEQDENRPDETAPGQYPHPAFEAENQVPLRDRDIEEQATPETVRDGLIDLYDDRSDLNYLQSEYDKANDFGVKTFDQHETVASVKEVETQTYRPEMAHQDIEQGTHINRILTVAHRLKYERENMMHGHKI